MILDKAYVIGIHRYEFKTGDPGEIVGVNFVTHGKTKRLCYHVKWADGAEDWFACAEAGKSYEIISFNDIFNGNIPKISK